MGVSKLARVGLDGAMTDLTSGLAGGGLDRPYSGGSFDVSGGVVAFTAGDTTHPADLAVLGKGGAVKRLTNLNGDLFTARPWRRSSTCR